VISENGVTAAANLDIAVNDTLKTEKTDATVSQSKASERQQTSLRGRVPP
jgi:hypothetical protein